MNVLGLSSSVNFPHTSCCWKFFLLHYCPIIKSKSKSHCDWRCRAPSGAHDQIHITLWQLRSCFCVRKYPAYNSLALTAQKTQLPTILQSLSVDCWGSHVIATQLLHSCAGCCLATAVVSFDSPSLSDNVSIHHNVLFYDYKKQSHKHICIKFKLFKFNGLRKLKR
jgi:hypothetical protein